jgi:Ion transport protein.
MIFLICTLSLTAMQFAKGKLRNTCVNDNSSLPETESGACSTDPYAGEIVGRECGHEATCLDADPATGRFFSNPLDGNLGFDNFPLSCLTVLVISSLEGHEDIMYMLIRVLGMPAVIFIVAVVVLMSIFAINLIVAVIFQVYEMSMRWQQEHGVGGSDDEEAEKNFDALVDDDDSNPVLDVPGSWRVSSSLCEHSRDSQEETAGAGCDIQPKCCPGLRACWSEFRDRCYELCQRRWFERLFTILIFLNLMLLASEFDGQGPVVEQIQAIGNLFFTGIFAIEFGRQDTGATVSQISSRTS